MNKPFVRDNAIFIPTNDNAYILPEYCDETVIVADDVLTAGWGWRYHGGKYRHRATDNPEADLAAVRAVYESNTAPKPGVPHVSGANLYIPADKNGILPDYRDPSVKVVGMALDPDWGYQSINRKFRCNYARNPEAALVAVLEVYERNTNKDVVITITKLPPKPHPESGTEIPVPKCRVEMNVKILDATILNRGRLAIRGIPLTTQYWGMGRKWFYEDERMSEAVAKAEAEAAAIRAEVRRIKVGIVAYDEKRAAAIAAADEEYERRANS